jgi:hypothetical protein
MGGHADSS